MVQTLRGRGLKAARKAATGQSGSHERCVGRKGEPCIFSIEDAGGAARAAPARNGRCPLCCAENLGCCLSSARGKGLLTCALAFYKENDFNAFSQALRPDCSASIRRSFGQMPAAAAAPTREEAHQGASHRSDRRGPSTTPLKPEALAKQEKASKGSAAVAPGRAA